MQSIDGEPRSLQQPSGNDDWGDDDLNEYDSLSTMYGRIRSVFPLPCASINASIEVQMAGTSCGTREADGRMTNGSTCIVLALYMPRDLLAMRLVQLQPLFPGQEGWARVAEQRLQSPAPVPPVWPSPGWFAPNVRYSSAPTPTASPTPSKLAPAPRTPSGSARAVWIATCVTLACIVLGGIAWVWWGPGGRCHGGAGEGGYQQIDKVDEGGDSSAGASPGLAEAGVVGAVGARGPQGS